MSKLTKCRNCGQVPTITHQPDEKYPYRLDHKNDLCPARFGLESHQRTKAHCIHDWNRHNGGQP